jgi:hypothetical protein
MRIGWGVTEQMRWIQYDDGGFLAGPGNDSQFNPTCLNVADRITRIALYVNLWLF